MKRIIYLLELVLFSLSINLFSQAYMINTNYCIVTNNAYLIVNGHINNQSVGNLLLTGTNSNVIVQNNITNDGTINSHGIIDLYGNWINNSTYTHNSTSYVYLKGGNQNIGGSASTTFYNLYLQGTGVKTLGVNEFVDGTLNLQDRELATQNYTMTVNNPLVASVQRTTGFVSSTVGGGLARTTNSTSTYLFPVGVSSKYRPADITPSSTTTSTYKVRMANGDATSEGYNRNNKAADICEVNPSFFHIMQQTSGTSNNANIKVYYDNTIDGSWDKVGNWNGSLWNNYTGSSTSSGSPLYYGTANNVSLSSSTPIALTKNAPTLTASASPASICAGSTSTLSASGASSYSWTDGTNNYSGNNVTVSPTANTTYTVTGTSGTCSATATVAVTVNPSPTLTVNATPPAICSGNNSSLTASGATSYSWTDGTNNYSGNNITVSPASTTTYTVTGSSGTCSATATVLLTVNSLPSININATNTQLCTGESTTLTASGANTYSWSNGNNGSSITVTPSTSTTYTVTGTSAEGCTNTASIAITVNSVPNISASASPNTICIGGSSTLSASGADTYNWSNSMSGATITVSPSSTTTYTVTGTSTTGCTNTATVTISVSTTINIIATASPSSICQGNSSLLSASGGDTYIWSNSMSGSTITVIPNNTTSYTVTGSSGGCTGIATVSVTVNPLPTVAAIANPTAICNGETSVLTASGASTYSWSGGIGSGSSKTVTPSATTTYTVTGSSAAGCTGTTTVSVTVNPLPTITATANPSSICNGETSVLTASGANIYSWNIGGNTASITVTPSATTTYTVTGTNEYDCSATYEITINVLSNADATINPINSLCDNQGLITLTANTNGGVWSGPGITNQVLGTFNPSLSGSGTFTITYMISGQCGDTATTQITVYESPNTTAYATDETCIDANDGTAWVEVTNGTPPYAFLWSIFQTIDSVTNLAPGEYYVTVTDFHNCLDKDTVVINPGTEDCYITHIYIPNIFAPDGKGNAENEYLRVYGKGIKTIDFTIFDRWGNEVFHTTDISVGWDGTYKGQPALVGDYTYLLRVNFKNGKRETLSGHILLIR